MALYDYLYGPYSGQVEAISSEDARGQVLALHGPHSRWSLSVLPIPWGLMD